MLHRILWRDLMVAAAVVLFWFFVAWPWLSGAVTIPYDAKAHFQAQLQFLANALHRGDSPFWTPNVFAGSPQIADPQSLIFSPAFLLALFDSAPSFRSLDAYVLVLLLVGALAVAQYGAERGWTPLARMAAALVFAFGASAAWRLQHVGQVQSLACLAVAFWLLARALHHGSWRSGLAAGAAAGVMLATPDQIAYLGVWFLAAYAIWFLLHDGRPVAAIRQALPALVAGSVAGLAIVAIPLTLTMLFAEATSRAEIGIGEAGAGSLHPAFLLTGVVADLFGAADPKVEFWGPSSGSWSPGMLTLSQNMGQIYLGALPFAAVLLWLTGGVRRIRPEARFLLAALVAMLVYALGRYTPAFEPIFLWLPGADLFRRPADATFLIGMVGALLTGQALSDLAADKGRVSAARWGVMLMVLVVIFACAALLAGERGQLRVAAPAIAMAALWFGLALVALMVVQRALAPRVVAGSAIAVAALLAVDLRWNNGPNESTGLPPSVYAVMEPNTNNDTIRLLKAAMQRRAQSDGGMQRDRVELVGVGFHWPNLGMIHGFDHAFGYNPLHLADFTEATGASDHMGEAQDRRFTPLFPSFRSPFADLMGLRYIVCRVPVERVDLGLKPGDLRLLARTRDGYIYENPSALSRAMFVGAWKVADFERIKLRGFERDFDPRQTVLLDTVPAEMRWVPPSAAPSGGARLLSYGNTEVVIEVSADGPGFVLLNDIWHPWWSATVNGEEADVFKANVMFRAVAVEKGVSRVVFRFRPLEGAIAELRERLAGEGEASDLVAEMAPAIAR